MPKSLFLRILAPQTRISQWVPCLSVLQRAPEVCRNHRTKSGEATSRSAHESFDARPGNQTRLFTLIFLRTERYGRS